MNNEYLVSLDLGTYQVRAVVVEMEPNGNAQIVGIGTAESKGIKKGAIINIEQAVYSIRQAIDEAERMVGIEITEVFVGISGNHVSLQESHGVVAVSDENREIGSHDIERVIQAAKMITLPPERVIIEVVPKQFVVDGLDEIRDPHGMIGVRLEVDALIITGSKTIIHNIMRCVEKASLHMIDMVFLPLAMSEACLSADEKNLGAVLADIGGGTISLAVYHQGYLSSTAVIPIGGEFISNDIAYGLRVPIHTAEAIKCKYGVASMKHAKKDTQFSVKTIGNQERKCSPYELARIMEPRIVEMFQLIRQQVQSMGYFSDEPAGGYVLTGSVLATPYILQVATQELGQVVRIAKPESIGVNEPTYISGMSMIRYLLQQGVLSLPNTEPTPTPRTKKQRGFSSFERFKSWLSEFI